MNAIVLVRDGEVRASSRDVADAFDKQHKNVLVTIDRMVEQAPEATAHFSAVAAGWGDGREREARAYEMTRDGFCLLAMGFTGPKALKWKLAYIEAFNAMEAELAAEAANDRDEAIIPAEQLDKYELIRVGLQLVREARLLGGRAAGRRAWAVAQLPDVFSEDPVLARLAERSAAGGNVELSVRSWAGERLEAEQGAVTPSGDLYESYSRWCARDNLPAVTQTKFGRSLRALGIIKTKTQGGLSAWRGIKLRD